VSEAPPYPTVPCKWCREPIIWAQTQPNPKARSAAAREPKLLPMDAEPVTNSLFTLSPGVRSQDNPTGRPVVGQFRSRNQAAGARAAGVATFQQHWKTCSRIEKWPKGQHLARLRNGGGR